LRFPKFCCAAPQNFDRCAFFLSLSLPPAALEKKAQSKRTLLNTAKDRPERRSFLYGPSVIIGSQKTQIYQWFAGSRQEVFILKILKFENNAAQQDNGRHYHNRWEGCLPIELIHWLV